MTEYLEVKHFTQTDLRVYFVMCTVFEHFVFDNLHPVLGKDL